MTVSAPRVPVFMLVPAMAALAGCAQQARFTSTRDLQAPHIASSAIEARTDNGSITLSAGSGDAVEIDAEIRAMTQERADATVIATERQADGTLLISIVWPDGKRLSDEACSLTILAPEVVGVRLFTSNGEIDARGTAGEAILRTSNGEVVLTDHQGSASADTSNGRITLIRVGGAVDARSSNGDVRIESAPGAVHAETSNGSVDIALSGPGPVQVRTSNGPIRLDVGPAFAGQIDIRTSNGSIRTGSAVGAKVEKTGRRSARLSWGAGGTENTLTTSNGSVNVSGGR
jgi:hypothetical protein